MPHVIYLHSALTTDRVRARDDAERRTLLRFERIDVTIAMTLAGLVNMAMLVIAASLFSGSAVSNIDDIRVAHGEFSRLAGGGAALAFAMACWPPGWPARASAPTRARWSCRASSTGGSR